MKKVLNDVNNVVDEMLEGIVYSKKDKLYRVKGTDVVARLDEHDKVGLVSGGGSGHEPAHAGFVGYGMLSAAVSGQVFTSPTPDQVLEGIKASNKGKGVLLVIKNYTGDVLNFEMAKEMAEMEGISVEQVVVADDIAVENSLYTIGKRGIAGTVFVHKIAGSLAEDGGSLPEVKDIAQNVCDNLYSLGMSLGGCSIPASGVKSFDLAEDEIEMGLGIHGEPGTHKEKLKTSKEHVSYMLDKLLSHSGEDGEFAVLVNGLGSTTLMELYVINKDVNEYLENRNVKVYRNYVGTYMSSLEMPGFSITLLKLNDKTKKYLDFKIGSTFFD